MREILGNIPDSSRMVFWILSAAAMICFAWGVWRRVRVWRLGRRSQARLSWSVRCRRFFQEILFQRRVIGRGLASAAHVLLFSGFIVLSIGTALIAVEHLLQEVLGRQPDNPVFHYGIYYAIYEMVLDTFGIALIIGCLMFMKRRWQRPPSIDHRLLDWLVLLVLLTLGITGYVVEGLRIIAAQTPEPGYSFVGLAFARLFEAAGMNAGSATSVHLVLWWVHGALALGFVAAFPYTRLLHSLAGAANLVTTTDKLGEMTPVSMEEVEETGLVGVGNILDFTRQQLIQVDACVACGRCEEACPAFEAGKPLSPKAVVQDVRGQLDFLCKGGLKGEGTALHGEVISAETLWSCTTCSACVDVCPLRVSPLGLITDMRRHLIGEGELRGPPAQALQKSQRSGNPWGLPPQDRFAWAKDLNVPTVETEPDFEILYWVGCAAAYDRRVQRVARSVVKLLQRAGVKFAVLGPEERCTGESARRMGDEFVFQELAETNIATLNTHKVRRIVTHCPHCLNSLTNDYSQFGGDYEVVHHTVLLAELIEQGRLPRPQDPKTAAAVTYHDPCYLARAGNTTSEPRQLVQLSMMSEGDNGGLQEMPRHGRNTACCGAGGGRMWFDDPPAERIGQGRIQEALATGAETVAVSCPFCLIMIKDGIAAENPNVEVQDVAEILATALEEK